MTFSPWNKNYDKPRQCITKQRHHFAETKAHLVKAKVFPGELRYIEVCDTYRCNSWTIKKAEC